MKNIQEQIAEIQNQLEVMQAFLDGKEIEYSERILPYQWYPFTDGNFHFNNYNYRIKKEPKYHPFTNAEDCWGEMLKHQPFGWVQSIDSSLRYSISQLANGVRVNNNDMTYAFMFMGYTFIDGTPFGIKED